MNGGRGNRVVAEEAAEVTFPLGHSELIVCCLF
jgi:hypothetical protein